MKKFYEMDKQKRLEFVKITAGLSDDEMTSFGEPLAFESADSPVVICVLATDAAGNVACASEAKRARSWGES